MPYYVVEDAQEPIEGITPAFGDPGSARNAIKADPRTAWTSLTVVFVPTYHEARDWRTREGDRLHGDRPTVLPVPWSRWARQQSLDRLHFAHISAVKPGLIAYTPSEAWGYADRQLRVRPGRYLAEFHPDLSKAEVDRCVAQCKAMDDAHVLKIATSTEDIIAVYLVGPRSCMAASAGEYEGPVHPVSVYGESDLAVAYLGDPNTHVTARCVIWPARKRYTRIYGDETLRCLLEADGYSQGNLDGARVRVIRSGRTDVYVMPYIDSADYADIIREGTRSWFQLSHRSGEYSVRQTCGCTAEIERYTCDNSGCDEEVDEEGELCSACQEARFACDSCRGVYFDYRGDDHIVTDQRGLTMCSSCAEDYARTCESCSIVFYTNDFGNRESRERVAADVEDYCRDCQDRIIEERAEQTRKDEEDEIAQVDADTTASAERIR